MELFLVAGHAYSLIAAAEVHDRNDQLTRIVQCRILWGNMNGKETGVIALEDGPIKPNNKQDLC